VVKIPAHRLIEISKIRVHPNNIKEHPEKQIKNLVQLIKWVGFKDPIVIDKTGEIKAGHGRLIAAKRLGMEKVPFVELEGLTKKQMDLFMYMDNQINESPWIKENVQLLLQEIPMKDLETFDIDWEGVVVPPFQEEQYPAPEYPDTPNAKLGQVYQLGNHVIMCGDSLTQLNLLLQDKKPAMLFTDPPYGLGGYAGRSGNFSPVQGDDEAVDKFYNALPKDIPERYIWGNWGNIKSIDETPRDVIVWKKNNFGMGKGYRGQYEICLYFGKFAGSDSDLWEVKKDFVTEYKHPTQKPTELGRRAIMNSTRENDIVLDCYMGSGSTLIACEQTNRICYGMEIDPRYIDVIITRWENFTGRKAKLLR
jgi:hypothetical protein